MSKRSVEHTEIDINAVVQEGLELGSLETKAHQIDISLELEETLLPH